MVVNLDGFALGNGLGKLLQCHVGPIPGAVHREEAQACCGQPIQVAIGMSHQLVGLLGRGVQAEWVVYVVVHRERHRRISTVNTGAAGVHQVFDTVVAAAFQDVAKTDEVAVDV